MRKGIFTPFHKLRGFERRIQEPGSSSRQDVVENVDRREEFATSSIDKAVQSISEAAWARPTTKLLDSHSLPKLDAPTHPFQRLRAPLKIHHSLDTDVQKSKDVTRKKKRPLPAKKWRRSSSLEETTFEGKGMSVNQQFITSCIFIYHIHAQSVVRYLKVFCDIEHFSVLFCPIASLTEFILF